MNPRPVATESTRLQVLEQLRRLAATVEELAQGAGVTANAIRPLLVALERDGLIARGGVRRTDGVGKPPVVYQITEAGERSFSRAYPAALAGLVGALSANLSSERLLRILRAAGARLATGARVVPMRERGAAAAQLLEALGASVTVVPNRGRSVTVMGAGCPLADAVRECTATCEVVRSLLAESTGAKVTIGCEYSERPRCRFIVE
jgi:predicted ArsR family transcriptional regulator